MCGIDKYKIKRSQNEKCLVSLQCSDFGSGVSIKPGECLRLADECIRQGCQLRYFYIKVWWHGENNCMHRLIPPVVVWMWQSCSFRKTQVWHSRGPPCSVLRWHLVTGGCLSPEGAFPPWKFGRLTCGKATLLQTKQVETGVEVTVCEVPSEERRHTVPFSIYHLAKQHMDQDAFIQEAWHGSWKNTENHFLRVHFLYLSWWCCFYLSSYCC